MKIYTKTGDKGKTRLLGGCLVSKSDLRIDSYGSVDELNSAIGVVLSHLPTEPAFSFLATTLLRIQNELFNLGSLFACEDPQRLSQLPPINQEHISQLEKDIDHMTEKLPQLKNFILPGGTQAASFLHLARTICRRAERCSVKLYESHPDVEEGMVYLNRLSDLLFTAARFANQLEGINDTPWRK